MPSGKRRVINFRACLLIALYTLSALFIALVFHNGVLWGILSSAAFVGITVALFFLFRKDLIKKVALIIALAFAAIGATIFSTVSAFWTIETDETSASGIYGTVISDATVDGLRTIRLTDVYINGEKASGELWIYNSEYKNELVAGMTIFVTGTVRAVPLIDGMKVNGGAFRDNRRYICSDSAAEGEIVRGYKRLPVVYRIRAKIREVFGSALGERYGNFAYAMLTGDKTYLDSEITDYFSVAGLSHILAVSGLHLGFIVTLIGFLLSKLPIKRWIKAAITAVLIIGYVVLAGFTPSVMRAAIMSLIGVAVYAFGTRRDMLSSLCAAVAVIGAFAPHLVFETGFVLSVSCVFGIVLFEPPIRRALRKIKFPKFIASPLALGVSVQIGILPACVYYFQSFSLYSIPINLVAVPLITLTFMGLTLSLLLNLIIPQAALPIQLCGAGLVLTDKIAELCSNLPLARAVVFSSAAVFICYIAYFAISRFVMLKKLRPLNCALCALLCLTLIFGQTGAVVSKTTIVPLSYRYSVVSAVTTEDGNYLVGDIWQTRDILEKLKSLKLRSLKGILASRITPEIAYTIADIGLFYTGLTVYFPADASYVEGAEILIDRGIKAEPLTQNTNLADGFSVRFADDRLLAYIYEDGDMRAAFVPMRVNFAKHRDKLRDCNFLRTANIYENGTDAVFLINSVEEPPTEGNVIAASETELIAVDYRRNAVYIPKI